MNSPGPDTHIVQLLQLSRHVRGFYSCETP